MTCRAAILAALLLVGCETVEPAAPQQLPVGAPTINAVVSFVCFTEQAILAVADADSRTQTEASIVFNQLTKVGLCGRIEQDTFWLLGPIYEYLDHAGRATAVWRLYSPDEGYTLGLRIGEKGA